MSHMSASEKPAPAAGPLTARDHRAGDPLEVDDRLVEDVGAAADLLDEVDVGVLDARGGTS